MRRFQLAKPPLVMCLTNTVAANFTANVLLAIGAKPAMVEEPSEAAELAAVADAVLVNVGTLTPAQAEVIRAAVNVCNSGSVPTPTGSVPTSTGSVPRGGTPWVLDPVACQVLSYRRTFVRELLALKPTVIRGNRDEIDFLLGSVPDLLGSVPTLATGPTDLIRRGQEVVREIVGGVPLLQSVTATGCAQGAIVAAFLGWGQTPEEALESASRLMKKAGERAWERAKTPGNFQIALLDALSEIQEEA